ncbi:MAG: diphthamide biosynthesis enzyme Dph2 [Nitrososphaerota archaeon]
MRVGIACMLIGGYKVEVELARGWVRENRIRRALIQAPPGLRGIANKLVEELSSSLEEALLHGGGCWGGCDLAVAHARAVGADGIIHLGHARFLDEDPMPCIYLECRRADPEPLIRALEGNMKSLEGFERIGLGATVQWLDHIDLLKHLLGGRGIRARTSPPTPPLRYEGQVLGCAYQPLLKLSGEVDGYLVIGSRFHGLGLGLQTEKPIFFLDPELGAMGALGAESEKLLRSRYGYIEEARDARDLGLIVSIKPGQFRMRCAMRLKKLLERAGRKAEILIMDDVDMEMLRNSGFEAFINTACPRLSIEDQERIELPILLPAEALIMLGEARWEEVIRSPRYLAMEV